MLRVTNSLTRGLAALPARPLSLYSCGPTVYRYAHVGNLRTFLLADLVRRVLALHDVEVRAVQNITDVGHLADDAVDHSEDKMLVAAGLEGRSPEEIADHYTHAYLEDAAALNLLPFDAYPRATAHIDQMLRLVEVLLAKGHAYDTDEAVYFDVRSFPRYGQLSGNDVDALQAGHRSAPNPVKRFHADFALWRKAGERRQVAWDSPWGRGFPGWHIECSAMSMAYLGERIDVHLGGVDLAFPHHESEVAQSEAAVGHRVVDVWLHGEHLLSEGRKMAKSSGNFSDLRALVALGVDPLAFRLLCLQSRYRTQLNFTVDALRGADRTLARLRARTAELGVAQATSGASDTRLDQSFVAAVDDDLDTPAALRLVHAVAGGDGEASALAPSARLALLRRWDGVLGLDLDRDLRSAAMELPPRASELIAARQRARDARDFVTADRLREELAAQGVVVVDTPAGPQWSLQDG